MNQNDDDAAGDAATNCRMDGRVAIVTGAGRGIGRSHALLLAERGAAVIVNDLGTDLEGRGHDPSLAAGVAREICNRGGRAIADSGDISEQSAGARLVDRALESFGRIDAVVTNAGIVGAIPFEETSLDIFERFWRVHFGGTYSVARAAWPYFREQGYGRLVMTGSGAGLYGRANQAPYASAKAAIQGLCRVLALEGKDHGIRVNVVTPGAFTRMAESALTEPEAIERARNFLAAELVAPLVVWLSSEMCRVSGQTFAAWAGRIARVAVGTGRGMFDRELTAESIEERYAEIDSLHEFYEPKHVLDELEKWLDN